MRSRKYDKIAIAFENTSGTFTYFTFECSVTGRNASFSILVGNAAFSLIPAKTIIVEQKSRSKNFGLSNKTWSDTTIYVHPISVDQIMQVAQFAVGGLNFGAKAINDQSE